MYDGAVTKESDEPAVGVWRESPRTLLQVQSKVHLLRGIRQVSACSTYISWLGGSRWGGAAVRR